MSTRLIVLFCLVHILSNSAQTTWSFSQSRIARRVSSAEVIPNDETTNNTPEQYDSEDFIPLDEYSQIITSNKTNHTDKNLYVIKAVVYEIGILTDAPENDTDEDVQNERVDISIFNSGVNGSVIDLEHIPFPVQTNITGEAVSYIAPVSLNNILGLNTNKTDADDTPDDTESEEQNRELTSAILSPNDILPKVDSKKGNN